MYELVLLVHSWVRWVVLAAGLAAVVRGGAGNGRAGRLFAGVLDLQMLLGLLLYFVWSPLTRAALGDFAGAMKNPQLRFFAVEHLFGMVIAIVLAHVGTAKVRKAPTHRKGRTAAIFYGLALVAVLASIPWAGMTAGRPLFRW